MSLDDPTTVPFDNGPFEALFTAGADDETTELTVKIPDFDDGENDFGPVVWHPQHDGTLPAAGDTALVARSDTGRWWALAWTPAT